MKKTLCLLFAFLFVLTVSVSAFAEREKLTFGYLDRQGNVVIEPQFDYAYPFKDGLARYFVGELQEMGAQVPWHGSYGYINMSGEIVIPAVYDKAEDFRNGRAVVVRDGKYGVIDREGNAIVDFIYDSISRTSVKDADDPNFVAYCGEISSKSLGKSVTYTGPGSGERFLLSQDGDLLFSMECDSLISYKDWVSVRRKVGGNSLYAVYLPDGRQVTDFIWRTVLPAGEGLIRFENQAGLFGYMDLSGSILIPARFDCSGRFENGFAVAHENGRYCLINTAGETVREYDPEIDYLDALPTDVISRVTPFSHFRNGFTVAFFGETKQNQPRCKKGTFRFMDIDGNYTSKEFKVQNMYSVDPDGTLRVKQNDKWLVLDSQGKTVFKPVSCGDLNICGNQYIVYIGGSKKGHGEYLYSASGKPVVKTAFSELLATDGELIPFSY